MKVMMKDKSLPHQIDYIHHGNFHGGLQVKVTCNCGWTSDRCIFNHQDGVALYRKHLYYPA